MFAPREQKLASMAIHSIDANQSLKFRQTWGLCDEDNSRLTSAYNRPLDGFSPVLARNGLRTRKLGQFNQEAGALQLQVLVTGRRQSRPLRLQPQLVEAEARLRTSSRHV